MTNRPPGRVMYYVQTEQLYGGESTVESVAFHEAGHAILRRLTGLPLDTIAMRNDDDGAVGFVSSGYDPGAAFEMVDANDPKTPRALPDIDDSFRKPLAIRRACVALAGLQSELLLHGHKLDCPIIRRDSDHQCARSILRDGFGFDHLFYAQLTTRFYLEQHWAGVCSTAGALLTRHRHCGEAILLRADLAHATYFLREFKKTQWRDEIWD